MAHECPMCGMFCHCGGDIGDLLFCEDEREDCDHCEDEDDYYHDEQEDEDA